MSGSDLFNTGVRPAIDAYLQKKSEEVRDYGAYWSASSAGYCMRKVIFDRLGLPETTDDITKARKTRIFESGHIFHEWVQRVTKDAGISVAQELELEDDSLMIRGHIDDLILSDGVLMLVDYKTQNSRAFSYQKDRGMSYFHRMQLGTYMYMIRKLQSEDVRPAELDGHSELSEARIIKISKDDLRMSEDQLLWGDKLATEIKTYWQTLNSYWQNKKIPPCTCAEHEGGFMAGEKYNPYFYDGEPCSVKWLSEHKELVRKWREA